MIGRGGCAILAPGRRVPRGAALRRGGHPLRRARPGAARRGAAALRPGGPLPPARRARPPADPARTVSSAAVVGAGVFGASIARELDRRGWDVTLHEQYSPGNTRSGSGGDTRLLRFSHGDQEWYTLSAQRSLERWLELEAASGLTLFEPVGIAWFDTGASDFADQSERTLERLGIAVRAPRPAGGEAPLSVARRRRSPLGALRAGRRHPQRAHRHPSDRRRPKARGRPADTRASRRAPTSSSGRAARGCRSSSLASSSSGSPAATSSSSASTRAGTGHPGFCEYDGPYYGHGDLNGMGMKISPDGRGAEIDPDELERHAGPRDGGPRARLRRAPLPGAGRRSGRRHARLPVRPHRGHALPRRPPPGATGNWWLVGGGSGHGFKHGPTLAEYVADCIEGSREPESFHALGSRSGHAGLRTADIEA